MKYTIITSLLASGLLLSSCASMGDYNTVTAAEMGTPQQVLPATVIAAQAVTQESSSSTRNMGTLIGAGVGLGGGQLLGRGKGRTAATIGMAAAGALAGRYLADSMGRTKAQRLTVRIDGGTETFSFVQPIYKQVGAIPVGAHGMYYHGTNAHFVPDGQSAAMFY